MSDPLCYVCRGPTPCREDGDPGPFKTFKRREIPSEAFLFGLLVLGFMCGAVGGFVVMVLR
jgi:hypothetical protein